MHDDDHTPTQPSDPISARGRGVLVEGYEGLRAGAAIAAVRRLGLRPSLERVEGYEAGVQGFVVSQEPAQGSEVQPGGAVCLFIAAPARTILDADRGGEDERAGRVEHEADRGADEETGEPRAQDMQDDESHADEARDDGPPPSRRCRCSMVRSTSRGCGSVSRLRG